MEVTINDCDESYNEFEDELRYALDIIGNSESCHLQS